MNHAYSNLYLLATGTRTAIGTNTAMTSASLKAGICRHREHPYMIDKSGEPFVTAPACFNDRATTLVQRLTELGSAALLEATAGLGNSGISAIPLVLCLRSCPFELADSSKLHALTEAMIQALPRPTLIGQVHHILLGPVAGFEGLRMAKDLIHRGETDYCLVGGIDSYLSTLQLELLDHQDLLRNPRNRWGKIPGEAAGFCLLAGRRGARGQDGLQLIDISVVREPKTPGNGVCTGEALSGLFWQMIDHLPGQEQIDQVYCDLSGNRYRTDEFGFTTARVAGRFRDATDICTPFDNWGDIGAAWGPVCLNLASRQSLFGSWNLVWAGSDDGHRGAVLLHRAGGLPCQ